MTDWKRPLFIGIGWGLGTAVGLALIAGGFLWYQSRPKPPRPWNTAAIVSKEPPGFDSTSDLKRLEFTYSLENTTRIDYQIASETGVKMMARTTDGALTRPFSTEFEHLKLPVFIPMKQKALVTLSVAVSGIPEHEASETDEQYHERLRAYCEDKIGRVANFVIFDEANRYQINLPRWSAVPPTKSP